MFQKEAGDVNVALFLVSGLGNNIHQVLSPMDHVLYPHSPCSYDPMSNGEQTEGKLQWRQCQSYSTGCQDIVIIETRRMCSIFSLSAQAHHPSALPKF